MPQAAGRSGSQRALLSFSPQLPSSTAAARAPATYSTHTLYVVYITRPRRYVVHHRTYFSSHTIGTESTAPVFLVPAAQPLDCYLLPPETPPLSPPPSTSCVWPSALPSSPPPPSPAHCSAAGGTHTSVLPPKPQPLTIRTHIHRCVHVTFLCSSAF